MRTLALLFLLLVARNSFAQTTYSMSGIGWSSSIPSGTITEAGLDYNSGTWNSNTNQINVSFNNMVNGQSYGLYVGMLTSVWDNRLTLSVERTGNGTPSGISNPNIVFNGGSPAQEVTNGYYSFFWGLNNIRGRNISNIPMMYKVSGHSVLIPARTYSVTVYFTAVIL